MPAEQDAPATTVVGPRGGSRRSRISGKRVLGDSSIMADADSNNQSVVSVTARGAAFGPQHDAGDRWRWRRTVRQEKAEDKSVKHVKLFDLPFLSPSRGRGKVPPSAPMPRQRLVTAIKASA